MTYECIKPFYIEDDLDGNELEEPYYVETGSLWIMEEDGLLSRVIEIREEDYTVSFLDLDGDYSNFKELEESQ